MADDQPAGMSDTTRSLTPANDEASADGSSSSIHAATPQPSSGSTLDGSFVSGIDATSKDESGSGSSRSALEALKAGNSKPSALPQGAGKKAAADSSRDAAAEALKKFFDRK
jgi:hypothetical protein